MYVGSAADAAAGISSKQGFIFDVDGEVRLDWLKGKPGSLPSVVLPGFQVLESGRLLKRNLNEAWTSR